jgi:hypothetical protein
MKLVAEAIASRGVGPQAAARRPWLTAVFRPIATRTTMPTATIEDFLRANRGHVGLEQ